MNLRQPKIWIAVVAALAVGGIVVTDLAHTAPGPISAVHARHPDLGGAHSCAQCHGGWFGDLTGSCLACHAPIAEQLESGGGLHGSLGPERAKLCGSCHSEHHGADFALVNRLSFAMAGVADRQQFDHGRIGFAMAGEHLTLECSKCHLLAEEPLLPVGGQRYLGLHQDCAMCHHDAHEGRMQIACADCHGQDEWRRLEAKGHERQLPLVGSHAGLDCRACHAAGEPHSIEAAGERRLPEQARQCGDCHPSPHATAFVAELAAQAGKVPAAVCADCHSPEHATFNDARVTTTPEQHAASGFRLAKPHDAVACASCHAAADGPFVQRYPGRRADDCRVCHEDVHAGEFADRPFAAAGCIDCHARTHFEPHEFTVEKHALTGFTLTGSHTGADCHLCHKPPEPDTLARFRDTPGRCQDCHADAHREFFARFARELNATEGGSCAHCHGTTHFADRPQAGFDHGKWTGFAIAGAHAAGDCESCHARAADPDELGRRFGAVAAQFGPYVGCATCHQDPHEGSFDKVGLPRAVGGRTSCDRCHTETSFRTLGDRFAHGTWTGFPLQGVHERAACTACHARRAEPDVLGRSWERARGNRCDDCHSDPHAGQFATNGRTECRDCHRGAERFADLAFRHDVHSRFALGEQHAKLACSACHKPARTGEREVVVYRPLPTDCVDCHGGADTPFQRRRAVRR